jgi:hypothetical protein
MSNPQQTQPLDLCGMGPWTRLEAERAFTAAISVVQIGDAYAIRDGHHRVSVAKARGALTITALVA